MTFSYVCVMYFDHIPPFSLFPFPTDSPPPSQPGSFLLCVVCVCVCVAMKLIWLLTGTWRRGSNRIMGTLPVTTSLKEIPFSPGGSLELLLSPQGGWTFVSSPFPRTEYQWDLVQVVTAVESYSMLRCLQTTTCLSILWLLYASWFLIPRVSRASEEVISVSFNGHFWCSGAVRLVKF